MRRFEEPREEASLLHRVPFLSLLIPFIRGPSLDGLDRYRHTRVHAYTCTQRRILARIIFIYLMLHYRALQFALHGDDLLLQALGYLHASRQVVNSQSSSSRIQQQRATTDNPEMCISQMSDIFRRERRRTRRETPSLLRTASWIRQRATTDNGGGEARLVVSSRPSHPLRTSAVSSLRSCAEPSEIALRGRATNVYTCMRVYACAYVCVSIFLSLPLTLFFPLLLYHFLLLSHTARPSTNLPSTRDAAMLVSRDARVPFALPGRELRRRTGRRVPEKKKYVYPSLVVGDDSDDDTSVLRCHRHAALALAQMRTAVSSWSRAGALLVLSPCFSYTLSQSVPFADWRQPTEETESFPAPSMRDSVQLVTKIPRSVSISLPLFSSPDPPFPRPFTTPLAIKTNYFDEFALKWMIARWETLAYW